ncbi:MAG: hypothetical protein NT166_10140 [Candidatus Aminicenantes bacterium]|nr:hypothetical protein [Candidatus Aminicenantes bacterium]
MSITTIIHIVVEIAILVILVVLFAYTVKKLEARIKQLENKVTHLSTISRYFPEFIEKGETITKNITEDLLLKQDVLKKLIIEAEKASEKLSYVEEKIKEKKLDKVTIDKVLILVNQGFTPSEIADRLNIPLGEIELIIKLRKYLSSPIKEKL